MIKTHRLPLLFLAIISLSIGLWAGLTRIGWQLPVNASTAHHGAIMVGSFLGTLIALEKIIPLKYTPLYLFPSLSALSALFFFTDFKTVAFWLLLVASGGLVLVFFLYLKREKKYYIGMMLAGAVCWMIGNILLLTKNFYPLAFPWWSAFILFIITAERIELMKFLPVSKTQKKWFLGFLTLYTIGIALSFHGIGNIFSGVALILISLWLMRNDLIGITMKKSGLPKFVAVSLLAGYGAMLLSGILFITFSNQWLAYDAIVHTFFIGFVFSMIFAHGPIILPGVLGSPVKPFHKMLYVWLLLLHASWLIRLFADAFADGPWRKTSGLLSAISILGYFVTLAYLTARQHSHGKVR